MKSVFKNQKIFYQIKIYNKLKYVEIIDNYIPLNKNFVKIKFMIILKKIRLQQYMNV